jgi:hypothetical protein
MRALTTISVALVVSGTAGTAVAQAPRCADIADPTQRLVCYDRQNVNPRPAAPPRPSVRTPPPDPDPLTVGKDKVPVPPEDRAFDPHAQRVRPEHIGLQVPPLRRVGTVPISSGPGTNVPIVTIEAPQLRAVPGDRWIMSLVLANNSGREIDARIACSFRNGTRPVADVAVMMRDVLAGDRVAGEVAGPPVTDFVDNVQCRTLSPLE